jgi:hypothetical protein
MADAAGVLILTRDLEPRTLLYAPPMRPGGFAGVMLPAGTPDPIAAVMIAVGVGLYLDGTPTPAAFADGEAVGGDTPRHRAAVDFARAFVSTALAPDIDARGRVRQAG